MWSDVTHALSASNVAWVVIVTVRLCPSDLCMVYAHVTLSLRWPFGPPRGEAPTRRTLLYGLKRLFFSNTYPNAPRFSAAVCGRSDPPPRHPSTTNVRGSCERPVVV